MKKIILQTTVKQNLSTKVLIGSGIFDTLPQILSSNFSSSKNIFIISESNILALFNDKLSAITASYQKQTSSQSSASEQATQQSQASAKNNSLAVYTWEVSPGESSKSFENLEQGLSLLQKYSFTREDLVIAFGGGMIGDLSALLSSLYMRGLKLLFIPTTLLAQVDSAIGGKSAINFGEVKNLVGSFYPANIVISDLNFLKTLPDREFYSGMAEVIKYGLILSEDFFSFLEENVEAIKNRQDDVLLKIIEECTRLKIETVEADFEDKISKRALLNFGHTFGHVVEKFGNFSEYLHGEAIAIGMVKALEISEILTQEIACNNSNISHPFEKSSTSILKESTNALDFSNLKERLLKILEAFNLPTKTPLAWSTQFSIQEWEEALRLDKKSAGNTLNFVVLDSLGTASVKKLDFKFLLKFV